MAEWKTEIDKEAMQSSFELLQPGVYTFNITEKEDTSTQKEGLPMVKLTVAVVEGPSEGSMFHRVVCYKHGHKMHWQTKHFLQAIGLWDGEADEVEFDTDEMIGRSFMAEVDVRPYTAKDGSQKESNNIKRVLIPEGIEPSAKQDVVEEVVDEELGDAQEPVEEAAPVAKPQPVHKKPALTKAVSRPAPKITAKATNGHKKELATSKRRF